MNRLHPQDLRSILAAICVPTTAFEAKPKDGIKRADLLLAELQRTVPVDPTESNCVCQGCGMDFLLPEKGLPAVRKGTIVPCPWCGGKITERITSTRPNPEAIGGSEAYAQAIARAEVAESELNRIDSALARRPALADFQSRVAKVEHACSMAGRAEAAEARVKELEDQKHKLTREYGRVTDGWSVSATNEKRLMAQLSEAKAEVERLQDEAGRFYITETEYLVLGREEVIKRRKDAAARLAAIDAARAGEPPMPVSLRPFCAELEAWGRQGHDGAAALRVELQEVIGEFQRLQPGGSPPPGGPVALARWIRCSVGDRLAAYDRAEGEIPTVPTWDTSKRLDMGSNEIEQRLRTHIETLRNMLVKAKVELAAFGHELQDWATSIQGREMLAKAREEGEKAAAENCMEHQEFAAKMAMLEERERIISFLWKQGLVRVESPDRLRAALTPKDAPVAPAGTGMRLLSVEEVQKATAFGEARL